MGTTTTNPYGISLNYNRNLDTSGLNDIWQKIANLKTQNPNFGVMGATGTSATPTATSTATTAVTSDQTKSGVSPDAGKGFSAQSIGSMIGQGWGIANNAIGNQYTKHRNAFDGNVMGAAYGDSTSDPLFGNIGLRTKANNMANDFRNETFTSNARNSADLARDMSENNGLHDLVQGPSSSEKAVASLQKVGSGAAKGAEIGSVAGPYGMAIGAIVGAVAGGVSSVVGNKAGERRLNKINKAINYSNNAKNLGMQTAVNNMTARNMNNYDANMIAEGGFVNMVNNEFEKQENINYNEIDKHNILRGMGRNNSDGLLNAVRNLTRGNRYAEGGSISNAQRDFKGVTEFNTGGSHEENKNGGIPQGVDNEGVPNLVEEGEVKVSDITGKDNQYILSNRIALDKETADEYGIDSKLVGMTFASAFKKAYGPYKERQGSPEVRNEVAHLINNFQQAQESIKQKQEMEQKMAMLERLTPEQLQMLQSMAGEEQAQDEAMAQQQAMEQQQMAQDPMAQQQMMQEQQAMQDPAMQQQMAQDPNMGGMPMAPGGEMAMSKGGYIRKYSVGGRLAKRANMFAGGDQLLVGNDSESYYAPIGVDGMKAELKLDEILRRPRLGMDGRIVQPTNEDIAGTAPTAPVLSDRRRAYLQRYADQITRNTSNQEDPRSEEEVLNDVAHGVTQEEDPKYWEDPDEQELFAKANHWKRVMDESKVGTPEYEEALANYKGLSSDLANLRRRKTYKELGIRELDALSNLRKAPVGAALNKLINRDKWHTDTREFDDTTKEGLARSMTSAPIVGEKYRPNYLDPNFGNNQLLSQTAQALRNSAMLSGGNRAMAAAYAQQAFNTANQARGQALYNGMLQNETMRKQAYDYNNAIDQANRQAIMQSDNNNSAHTFSAYNNMAQNRQDAKQYNLNTDSNFYDNAFQQMGNLGQDSFNRSKAYKMVANGLMGKGAENTLAGANGIDDKLIQRMDYGNKQH